MTRVWPTSLFRDGVFARWRDNASGAAAIEFAMLSPVFMSLLAMSVMVGVIYFAKSELDLATRTAARSIKIGQVTNSAQLTSLLCNTIGGMFDCNGFMVNLRSYPTLSAAKTAAPTITYNADGTVANAWTQQFGASGAIMVLQVMYQYPTIAGPLFSLSTQSNGSNLLISTAVFINE